MGTLTLACLIATGGGLPAASPVPGPAVEATGSLWPTEPGQPGPAVYYPREGDIVFLTRRSRWYGLMYFLARSSHPYHAGIVVRRVTGDLAVLESGVAGYQAVTLRPVGERLENHFDTREPVRVWVRRPQFELTVEQSRSLTAFAEGLQGRAFSDRRRMLGLAVPGRSRTRSTLDQESWLCTELVAQAIVSAGLFPADAIRPQAMTPFDVLRDRRTNLSPYWSGIFVYSPTYSPPPPGPRLARP